jgi:transcriptional regulator with XRE-family HTH domain
MLKHKPAVEILARNLNALMEWRGTANRRLATACGIGEGSIQRIRRGQAAATLTTIEAIAKHFGFEPWQLLIEDFDPRQPPHITMPSSAERELYERFRKFIENNR